jgi:hypothetical protein
MNPPNPYAAPKAVVLDVPGEGASADQIRALKVSESWKQKFVLIARAGGPNLSAARSMTAGERMKIGFNVFAFLFGPFYYLAKGMWRKAIVLAAIVVGALMALEIVLNVAGIGQVAKVLGYGGAAVFGARANLDYYKKVVLGDNGWL